MPGYEGEVGDRQEVVVVVEQSLLLFKKLEEEELHRSLQQRTKMASGLSADFIFSACLCFLIFFYI